MNLPATPPRLRFFVLGPLEVRDAAGALPLRRDRHRELVGALLAHRPAAAPASELIDALWGPAAPPSSSTTLRAYVSLLRNVLGDDSLLTEGGGYRLDAPVGAVDLDVAEHLASAASDAMRRNDPAAARQLATDALRQWRGPVLGHLGRRTDAGALGALIRRAELQRASLVELVLRARVDLGEGATVLPDLQTAAVEHPDRESLRCLLITALYRSGRHVEAVREAASMRAALADVGLVASPELVALERAVLTHDRSLLAPTPVPASMLPERRRNQRPEPHTAPLVGRDEALQSLQAWTSGGVSARVAVVVGRAGEGKTRLLRDVQLPADVRELRTSCLPNEAEQPWSTVAALVRQVLPLVTAPAWVRDALCEVVPELAGRAMPGPSMILDAATHLLQIAASNQPVVWIADDLHRASPATIALVHLVASGRIEGARALLATRPDAPAHVAELLASVLHQGAVSVVLAPLDAAQIGVLLQHWVDADGSDLARMADSIHRTSSGHPLFVTMLVHDLAASAQLRHQGSVSTGDAVADPGAALGPHVGRLGAYLDATVRSLGPAARRGLETLAVAGRPIVAAAWFDAWGAEDPTEALAVIEASGLVRVDADGRYLLHDLVAANITSSMSPGAVLLTHRRLGRAKAAREPSTDPSELLSHAMQGADDPAIVRWSLQLAASGMVSEPLEVLARHLDNAQAAIGRLDAPADASARELAALHLGLARRSADFAAIDRRAHDLRRLARAADDVESELEAISALADSALETGRHHAGIRLSDEAIELADASRSPRADEIAVSLWFALAPVRSEPFCEQLGPVRELLRRRSAVPGNLAMGVALVGRLSYWEGRLDEAVEAFASAAGLYQQRRHVRGLALSLGNVARTWLLADPLAEVGDLLGRARQLLADAGHPNLIDDDVHAWRLRRAAASGQPIPDDDLAALGAAFEEAVRPGLGAWALDIALEITDALRSAGRTAEGTSFLERVLGDRAAHFPPGSPNWSCIEVLGAQHALWCDDPRSASRRAGAVIDASGRAVPAVVLLRAHDLRAVAARGLGDDGEAAASSDAATRLRQRLAGLLHAVHRPDAVLERLDREAMGA